VAAVLNAIRKWLVKEETPGAARTRIDAMIGVQDVDAQNASRIEAPGARVVPSAYVRILVSGDNYRASTDKAPMLAWLESLPPMVRPTALSGIHPRIVKKIMRLWSDDAGLKAYLDDLSIDRRGGRIGFPPKVATEILRLQVFVHRRGPPPTQT